MDTSLTPIRVRGKRRRIDQSSTDQVNPAVKNAQGTKKSQRRKRFKANRSQNASAARLVKNAPRQINRSGLLSLPSELIEKIFLYSLEINFPRSSLHVARAVSRERIYKVLFLLAFWEGPTSSVNHGAVTTESRTRMDLPPHGSSIDEHIPKIKGLARLLSNTFSPICYVPLSVPEKRTLQSQLLPCRWCTLDRMKTYMPDIFLLSIKMWGVVNAGLGVDYPGLDENRPPLQGLFTKTYDDWDLTCKIPEGHDRLHSFCIRPSKITMRIHTVESIEFISASPITVLTIPEILLRRKYHNSANSWSDDRLSLLERLLLHGRLSGDAGIAKPTDFISSGAKQGAPVWAIDDGIRTAIVDRNIRLLRIFLYLLEHDLFPSTSNPIISGEYFITAARQCRQSLYDQGKGVTCNSELDLEILKMLVRSSTESIPYDDPEITAWATEAKERGDRFAGWLLNVMAELPVWLRKENRSKLFLRGLPYEIDRGEFPEFEFEEFFGNKAHLWSVEMSPFL